MGWFTKVTTFLKQGGTFLDAAPAKNLALLGNQLTRGFFSRQGMGGLCGVGGFGLSMLPVRY